MELKNIYIKVFTHSNEKDQKGKGLVNLKNKAGYGV